MLRSWCSRVVISGVALVTPLLAGCDAADPDEVPPARPTGMTTTDDTTTSTPEPDVFDHGHMQDDVYRILTEDYKIDDVGIVICPEGQPVVVDAVFHCTATVDGDQKDVKITVTSEDGKYTVSRPE